MTSYLVFFTSGFWLSSYCMHYLVVMFSFSSSRSLVTFFFPFLNKMLTFQTTDLTARSFVETAEEMLFGSLKSLRNLNECRENHNVPTGFVFPIQPFTMRFLSFLTFSSYFVDSYIIHYKSTGFQ